MSDKLKQIDKKYLIIVGAIFGILILIVVIAVIAKVISGKNLSYEKIENKLVEAAQDYINDGVVDAPAEGESIVITDKELISAEYIKELSEYTDDTCSATVTVMNNGGLGLYIPDLQCNEYMTQHLATKIIDDQLVTETIVDGAYQFGLYQVDDEYIFKGKEVNNYVSFSGVIFRIIKIDKNGNLRLIKVTPEENKIVWDEKYNADIGTNYGINDYANSYLAETLNNDYNDFKDENKKHLIQHDVCIGKRGNLDIGISYDFDCSTLLEKQYISTLTTLDVPMASLDPNCTTIVNGSCTNYNYMVYFDGWTVNSYSDNTYEVLVAGGTIGLKYASKMSNYYWVIYVSGQELYTTGSGTADDPYVIGQ